MYANGWVLSLSRNTYDKKRAKLPNVIAIMAMHVITSIHKT